jgi:hypothetical protein
VSPGPQLRDIQLPPEPGLWPWPPGVWLLVFVALLALLWLVRRALRAARRRRRLQSWRAAMQAILEDRAAAPIERVAAASELLRRAMREHNPAAAALEGAQWRARLGALALLPEPDRGLDLLVEGPWRARLDEADAQLALARASERLQRLLETFP